MTPFQAIALPLLGGAVVYESARWLRKPRLLSQRLPRGLIWAGAFVAIAWPDLVSRLAVAVGVTRGADLVFYVFVLAFLATSFFFYARTVRLQRALTEVVRHLAILEARRGGPAVSAPDGAGAPAGGRWPG